MHRGIGIAFLLSIPAVAHADDAEAYRKVVDSVAWVVAKDARGVAMHGTGVLIPEGILTAHHVVRGRAVSVIFPARDGLGMVIADAGQYSAGDQRRCSVIHVDVARDLALLRPDGTPPARPATLSGRGASPGERVFTIGGDGKAAWRYAGGDVRQVRNARPSGVRYVESSLPLNDGDSGGALFDAGGQVVAINSSSSKALSLVNQSVDVAEVRVFLKAAAGRKP